MRDLSELQAYALLTGEDGGAYEILYKRPRSATRVRLKVVASHGKGWDHVSVSLAHRTPTWDEMSYVKNMFFHADEAVMQLHVPTAQHINLHEHCLHLWRPQNERIPLPDAVLV
jgi:hypothetical protein